MFLHHLLGKGHILFLGLGLVHPLLAVPGIPLGLSFEVQHAGPVNIHVADSCLQSNKKRARGLNNKIKWEQTMF